MILNTTANHLINLLLRDFQSFSSNGSTLGYSDQRLFGRIGVTSSPEDFISEHHLGKDALEIDKDDFLKVLSGKRRSIKNLLMDQRLIAGIGNEYSDEILFQAGILPQRGSDSLKREDFLKIFNSMKMVLKTALKAHGDKKIPESFLLRNRRKGAKCHGCNTAMESFDWAVEQGISAWLSGVNLLKDV